MDRISRHSRGEESVQFRNLRIASVLFADDVVLLASSVCLEVSERLDSLQLSMNWLGWGSAPLNLKQRSLSISGFGSQGMGILSMRWKAVWNGLSSAVYEYRGQKGAELECKALNSPFHPHSDPHLLSKSSISSFTAPLLLPVAWLTSPGLSAAAHLQSDSVKAPLARSLIARLSFAFMRDFPVFFLGRISRLQFFFVMTSPPRLCPGKDLRLLLPTTNFICVLPDSWLPVSASAELQESPAITPVGFISVSARSTGFPASCTSPVFPSWVLVSEIKLIANSSHCVLQLGPNPTRYTHGPELWVVIERLRMRKLKRSEFVHCPLRQ